jgi:thiol-disulfide isomerase/thioredoxin
LLFSAELAQASPESNSDSDKTIVVTFFESSECPFCENVKELVDDLKTQLPIKTKIFDINRPDDYDLFCKIEATHSPMKFAVPLVIVGDIVLMGQSEIFSKLEDTIKRLQVSNSSNSRDLRPEHPENSKVTNKKRSHGITEDPKLEYPVPPSAQQEQNSHKIKIVNDDQSSGSGPTDK